MRVFISQTGTATPCQVNSFCAAGAAVVSWCAEQLPAVGKCDVEIDVPVDLTWGATATYPPVVTEEYLASDGQMITLVARVEEMSSDGVLTLRLAEGLLLVEVRGRIPGAVIGELVEIKTPELKMYPTNT
jgi:hypothetical protein